ncbi:hypothetical protein HYQ44_009383 [Verticillium longisporum]|nr:hypothetical protein HYQ44_009383 [Verticillium longisporum]
MAEVFGIVSAGVGIVAFIGQVSATLEKVSDAHQFIKGKAAEETASLRTQLHLLQIILQTLQPGDDNDMDVLLTGYHWHQFNTIQTSLSKLSTKLHERLESSSSLRRPNWTLVSNKVDRQLREEITNANLKVQALIQVMLLHAVVRPRQGQPKPSIEVHELPPIEVPIEDLCITDTTSDNMIVWLAKARFITVDQAQEQLSDFFRREPTARNHVNPSGNGYLEAMVKLFSGTSSPRDYLGLAKFIADSLGCQHNADADFWSKLIANSPGLVLPGLLEAILNKSIAETTVWIQRTPDLEACMTHLASKTLPLSTPSGWDGGMQYRDC